MTPPHIIKTDETCGVCGYELTRVGRRTKPDVTVGWFPTNRDREWGHDFGRIPSTIHICEPKETS